MRTRLTDELVLTEIVLLHGRATAMAVHAAVERRLGREVLPWKVAARVRRLFAQSKIKVIESRSGAPWRYEPWGYSLVRDECHP